MASFEGDFLLSFEPSLFSLSLSHSTILFSIQLLELSSLSDQSDDSWRLVKFSVGASGALDWMVALSDGSLVFAVEQETLFPYPPLSHSLSSLSLVSSIAPSSPLGKVCLRDLRLYGFAFPNAVAY